MLELAHDGPRVPSHRTGRAWFCLLMRARPAAITLTSVSLIRRNSGCALARENAQACATQAQRGLAWSHAPVAALVMTHLRAFHVEVQSGMQ